MFGLIQVSYVNLTYINGFRRSLQIKISTSVMNKTFVKYSSHLVQKK